MSSQGNLDLIDAAKNGEAAAVSHLLVRSDVDKNFHDMIECTALHWAAGKGHLEVVNALVQAGADVNLEDFNGSTALHWAANNVHQGVVNALVQAGAKVNLQNNDGWTALHRAADKGHKEVMNALVQAGANVNLLNNDGKTAFDLAKAWESKALMKQQQFVPAHASAAPIPAATGAEVESAVQVVLAQAAGAQARREWTQRRDALQAQFDAAEKANTKFSEIARLGKALAAADAESASLTLSELDFRTLAGRHKQLVAEIADRCRALMQTKEYDALERLSQLLESLQALDAAELVFPPGKPAPVYITDGREDAAADVKTVVIDNKR